MSELSKDTIRKRQSCLREGLKNGGNSSKRVGGSAFSLKIIDIELKGLSLFCTPHSKIEGLFTFHQGPMQKKI